MVSVEYKMFGKTGDEKGDPAQPEELQFQDRSSRTLFFCNSATYKLDDVFTCMHLADAFIQSNLQVFRLYIFCQYVCSLGIEPTTFALLTQCSNH